MKKYVVFGQSDKMDYAKSLLEIWLKDTAIKLEEESGKFTVYCEIKQEPKVIRALDKMEFSCNRLKGGHVYFEPIK